MKNANVRKKYTESQRKQWANNGKENKEKINWSSLSRSFCLQMYVPRWMRPANSMSALNAKTNWKMN